MSADRGPHHALPLGPGLIAADNSKPCVVCRRQTMVRNARLEPIHPWCMADPEGRADYHPPIFEFRILESKADWYLEAADLAAAGATPEEIAQELAKTKQQIQTWIKKGDEIRAQREAEMSVPSTRKSIVEAEAVEVAAVPVTDLARVGLTPIVTTPDRCEYLHDETGIRVVFASLAPTSRSSGLESWVEIRQGRDVLTFGTRNLTGSTTVDGLAKMANQDWKDGKENPAFFRRILTAAVLNTVQVVFDRHNAIDLADVTPTADRALLRPFLEVGALTRFIAAGGSFKSALAILISMTVAAGTPKLLGLKPQLTGTVLYLDWESDQATHAERMAAFAKGAGIAVPRGIYYMNMADSLYRGERRVAAAVYDINPILIVADSNAMARGATGDGGGAEESTLRMIRVLRSFGRSALIVDHKSQEAIRKGVAGGYGSIFNQNLARLEWEVIRKADHTDHTDLVLRLEKANNRKKGQELGYRFTITTRGEENEIWDTATVTPINPDLILEPQTANTRQVDKIVGWLSKQTEAQTVADIANGSHLTKNAVRSVTSRNPHRFQNVGTARQGLWKLAGTTTDEGHTEPLSAPPADDHDNPF